MTKRSVRASDSEDHYLKSFFLSSQEDPKSYLKNVEFVDSYIDKRFGRAAGPGKHSIRTWLIILQVRKQPEKTLPDIQSTEFALKWLKQRAEDVNCSQDGSVETCDDRKKPFFLAVGFHKPHIPLKFPMEFLGK